MILLVSSLVFPTLLILSQFFTFGGGNSAAAKKGDFLWGVATAAYQIEGGADARGDTIWDVFQNRPGKVVNGDIAAVADDSYHKREEDLALIKALGGNSYRFSLSLRSRIRMIVSNSSCV